MPGEFRIFVSSTMEDLANELEAVVTRLLSFNFTPINSESWLPNGTKAWEKPLNSS
jgi:hypothetical protein